MKKAFFTSVLILILTSVVSGQIKSDREQDGLSDRVKDVTTYTTLFTYSSGRWVEGNREHSSTDHYSEGGNLPEKREKYSYQLNCYNDVYTAEIQDNQGGKIEILKLFDRRTKVLRGKVIYIYAKDGRLIDRSNYDNENQIFNRQFYIYDDKNQLAEIRYYGNDGVLYKRQTFDYEYDSEGNWIKRLATERGNKSGQAYSHPAYAEYRLISYY
jgi:hypothetical protein